MATSILRTLAVRLSMNSAAFRKDTDRVQKASKRMSRSMRADAARVSGAMGGIVGAFALIGTGRAVMGAADRMNDLRNKMRAATKSSDELATAMRNVVDISKRSRADLDGVGTLYQRMMVATKHLGVTQKDVADATETVAKTFVISGTTALEAASSARQLAQGLASGKLSGDEFRSVSENNVRLMGLLAEGFGVTRGRLRELSAQGFLTAGRIMPILAESVKTVTAEVDAMDVTIGQASTMFKNEFTLMADRVNVTYGITHKISKMFEYLSNNMDKVVKVGVLLTGVVGLRMLKMFTNWGIVLAVDVVKNSKTAYSATRKLWEFAGNKASRYVRILRVSIWRLGRNYRKLKKAMHAVELKLLKNPWILVTVAIGATLLLLLKFVDGAVDLKAVWGYLVDVIAPAAKKFFINLGKHAKNALLSIKKLVPKLKEMGNTISQSFGAGPIFNPAKIKKELAEIAKEMKENSDDIKNDMVSFDDYMAENSTGTGKLSEALINGLASGVAKVKDVLGGVWDATKEIISDSSEALMEKMFPWYKGFMETVGAKGAAGMASGIAMTEYKRSDAEVVASQVAGEDGQKATMFGQDAFANLFTATGNDLLKALPEKLALIKTPLQELMNSFKGFGDSVESTFTNAIMGTESLAKGLKNLGKNVLKNVIHTFVTMGVTYVAQNIAMVLAEKVLGRMRVKMAKHEGKQISMAYQQAAINRTLATGGTNALSAMAIMAGMKAFMGSGTIGSAEKSASRGVDDDLRSALNAKSNSVGWGQSALGLSNPQGRPASPSAASYLGKHGPAKIVTGGGYRSDPMDQVFGQGHDGHANVPNTGTWLLEKGERVVGRDLNEDLTNFLNQGQAMGGSGGGLTLNVNGVSDPDVVIEALYSRSGELESLVRQIAADGAQGSPL